MIDPKELCIGAHINVSGERVEVDEILKATAEVYGMSVEDIIGENRKRKVSEARQMAIYLCDNKTLLRLEDLAIVFNRNHATIIHSLRKVDGMLEFDRLTKRNYELINEKLNERV